MGELFSNLGINAKVLVAQIINFAILLLILQKFAYKPVVAMLEKRRHEIEKANKHADEIEARIKNIEEAKEVALNEARKESTQLIKHAEAQAAQAAEKIVEEAKAQAKHVALAESKKLREQHEKLRQELRKEIGATIALAIEKTVGDVMDKNAKDKLLEKAISHIKTNTHA